MVDSQIVPSITAVLARIVIAMQHVAARQADFLIRDLDVTSETNDRRKWERAVNKFAVVLNTFRFAFQEQNHRTAPTAYVQGFV